MKVRTFSILAGSSACNARCPFCISKMTPPLGIEPEEPEVNWRNFRKAALLARISGVTTVMITGKGEPTLFPRQITKYLKALQEFDFPLIELQTNGIIFAENQKIYDKYLKDWYERSLNTIAISITHYDREKNRQIYLPYRKEYPDLGTLINYLHGKGFLVRLNCTLLDGHICDTKSLVALIKFARENKVEQLTIRPVNKPQKSGNSEVEKWVTKHCLKTKQFSEIKNYLAQNGKPLLSLPYGATVYDVSGQNVCLTNCLTTYKNDDDVRHLIFFPDGHLRFDWQYKGAILL